MTVSAHPLPSSGTTPHTPRAPSMPTPASHPWALGWDQLPQEVQARWAALVAEERLRAFEQDIEQLRTTNQAMTSFLPWLLGGPRRWAAPLALPVLTRRVRQYMHEIEVYGSEVQELAAPAAKRQLLWSTFPGYDRYNLLRARALMALTRAAHWFR